MKYLIILFILLNFIFPQFATNSKMQIDQNIFISDLGGVCKRCINLTGANTQKGKIVSAHATISNAITNCNNGFGWTGIMYSDNVTNQGYCWVVRFGVAEVLLQSNWIVTNGDRIFCTNGIGGVMKP